MKRNCSERVFTGARWDMSGHMCQISATVEVDGKWFCKRHSPAGVAEKKAKDDAKFEARMAAATARHNAITERNRRVDAYPKLVEALKALTETGHTPEDAAEARRKAELAADMLLDELGELK